MRVAAFLFCILSFLFVLPAASQTASQGGTTSPAPATSQRADDIQALRTDLERMKALIQQMQNNLSFVDTTQSPLKHQFELEIQMWNALIAQMERRLDATKPR